MEFAISPLSALFTPPPWSVGSALERFYIYGPGLVSQSTFEDEYFREMLQAYYEAAGGVPSWP